MLFQKAKILSQQKKMKEALSVILEAIEAYEGCTEPESLQNLATSM